MWNLRQPIFHEFYKSESYRQKLKTHSDSMWAYPQRKGNLLGSSGILRAIKNESSKITCQVISEILDNESGKKYIER